MIRPESLPVWVLDLVAAAIELEEVHAAGGPCISAALEAVPADVQTYAAGFVRGKKTAADRAPERPAL